MTVEDATNDLVHELANVLLIIGEARKARASDNPFMTDAELGQYAMDREPGLRLALDKLRAAQITRRIQADD